MPRPRLSIGDVFTIPTGDGRVAIGQVVGKYLKEALYLVVYGDLLPGTAVTSEIMLATQGRVDLIALSLDAKFANGDWRVVGAAEVPPSVELPAYKEVVGSPDRVDVVDYSGRLRRRAEPDEIATLPNRKVVAPVRLEKAVRAKVGLEAPNPNYSELTPRRPSSRDVFGSAAEV